MKTALLPLSALLAAAALAQEPAAPDPYLEAEAKKDAAKKALSDRLDADLAARAVSCADTNRFFVAKGVLADRVKGTVEVDAFTTGTLPGSICEFYFITLNSGHDYEAVFQTFAFASDLAKAFEFLGVPAGRSADYPEMRFWSAGERVAATASVDGAPPRPLGVFASDAASGATLDAQAFVYVGGTRLADGSLDVDSQGPGSIVPDYNEPQTLLDIPAKAPQGVVYGKTLVSTNAAFAAFLPAVVTFAPEKREAPLSPRRVADDKATFTGDGFLYAGLRAPDCGELLTKPGASPADLVKRLSERVRDEKRDVYLSFDWTPAVTLGALKNAATLLQTLDKDETGIRVDAPPAGFPYYQFILPDEEWRDREKRLSQPCELRFAKTEDGAVRATLVAIAEIWDGESLKPTLVPEEIPLASPADLPALLEEKTPRQLPVVLVFAPSSLAWSELAPWLEPVLAGYPGIRLFLD
ncbi:MAG: hypothetical protein IJV65_02160 [Kiritimatiellae bacterium]|nr:hypothetical protein [Kiritimatiellia bacterium]